MAGARKHHDYRLEANRLSSFHHWPLEFISAEAMAAAGFYYTGSGDKVQCFVPECHLQIFHWSRDDEPLAKHRLHSSSCRFARNTPCGNVSLNTDPETIPSYKPEEWALRTVCSSGSKKDDKLINLNHNQWSHPQYATPYARYITFKSWPEDNLPSKFDLIEAGFYYVGKGDSTGCYCCGGYLARWREFDNPWEQHAKYFTRCGFVKFAKGQKFIDAQLAKQDSAAGPIKRQKKCDESIQIDYPWGQHAKYFTRCGFVKFAKEQKFIDAQLAKQDSDAAGPIKRQKKCDESIQNSEGMPRDLINDEKLCKICFLNDLDASFQPCGHLMSCYKCAVQMPNCVDCGQAVINVVRVFLS